MLMLAELSVERRSGAYATIYRDRLAYGIDALYRQREQLDLEVRSLFPWQVWLLPRAPHRWLST